MCDPPHHLLILLQEHSRYALFRRGIYQPRDIAWSGGGGGVDGVWRQNDGIAPAKGVGIRICEIVLKAVCQQDEAWGSFGITMVGGSGRWEEESKLFAALTVSALHRESVLIFQ